MVFEKLYYNPAHYSVDNLTCWTKFFT